MRNEQTCLNETETALSARTAGPALACTLTSTFLSFHESSVFVHPYGNKSNSAQRTLHAKSPYSKGKRRIKMTVVP